MNFVSIFIFIIIVFTILLVRVYTKEIYSYYMIFLVQSILSPGRENEGSGVNLLVVVSVSNILRERSKRSLNISVSILRANHETNLTRRISRNGAVGVLSNRENILASLLKILNDLKMEPDALSLGGDDTLLGKSFTEELEVRLLEKRSSRSFGIGRVSDNDIKGVLVLLKELEAITNVNSDTGILEASGHVRKVLLRDTGNGLINVTENSLLDTRVLDDLTKDTTVTTTNDKNFLGIGMRVHGKVTDHLLVADKI